MTYLIKRKLQLLQYAIVKFCMSM